MATDIVLDEDTQHWLEELSAETGVHPAVLVASILRDLRIDDEKAHETLH